MIPSYKAPVTELYFDNRNPRLAEFTPEEKSSEEKILNILWSQMAVEEFVRSILSNGYFQYEALLVVEESGKKVVLDGNRRLAALKSILSPCQVQGMSRYVSAIDASVMDSVREVPVILLSNRSDAWPYIWFKHVNGPSKWGSYAKARYIATVHNEYGVSLDEISRRIGDNNRAVHNLYQALMVIEHAESETEFSRDDMTSSHLFFSLLCSGLQSPGFRRYLGLGDVSQETVRPVPSDKLKSLENVMFWLFGSKRKGLLPIVQSQNPDLDKLAEVLKDEEATMALELQRNLNYSFDVAVGAEDLFRNSLLDAKSELQKAISTVNGYGGEDSLYKVASELRELSGTLHGFMRTKRDSERDRRLLSEIESRSQLYGSLSRFDDSRRQPLI